MKDLIEVPVDLLVGLADAASESGYPIAGDAYELINEHKKKSEGDKVVFGDQMKKTIDVISARTDGKKLDVLYPMISLKLRLEHTLPCMVPPTIDVDMKKYLIGVLDIYRQHQSFINKAIAETIPLIECQYGREYSNITPSGLKIELGQGCYVIKFASVKFLFSKEMPVSEWCGEIEELLKSKIEELS